MAVEIYQNEELNDICFQVEALDEWKELAKELDMGKQLEFLSVSESPMPYPFINTSMKIIFETLCPKKVNYKAYDKTPIPLEVLKQIGYSLKEKHFNDIEIWYDDKTPDPFAIGFIRKWYVYNKEYSRMQDSNGISLLFDSEAQARNYAETTGFKISGINQDTPKLYLIARWADVIRPIKELKQMASERLIEKYGAALKRELESMATALKSLSDNVSLFLGGEISESQLKGKSLSF